MFPEGNFRANDYHATQLHWARPRNGRVGYDSGAGPNTGVIQSGPFRLPDKIHFATAGFLSQPGLRIYLLDEATKKTLDLRQRNDPGLTWRTHFWNVPKDWQGRTVRLVGEDTDTANEGWMGITAPEAGGESMAYSVVRATYRCGLLVLLALLFLLPGAAVAAWLSLRQPLDFVLIVTTILCGSGVVCYLVFWVYFLNPLAGKNVSLLILLVSLLYLIWNRHGLPAWPALRESAACFGFALLVSVFFAACGFLFVTDDPAGGQAQVRYNHGFMPPDNVLPYMLADRLYNGEPLKPPLVAYWKVSDRPPLQAAAALLVFRPAREFGALELLYQMIGIFLQSISLIGVWVLVRAAGLGNRYLAPILAFLTFSEIMSFHSFYIWPKLLAGGFMLLAMAFVFRAKWTMTEVLLSWVSIALALLSHTGVLFTLLPFVVFTVCLRRVPSWKQLSVGLAAALLLLIPWRLYQTIYDPPGDYLLKFNMTNAHEETALKRPFGELLKESYSKVTPAQFLRTKWADVKFLVGSAAAAPLISGNFQQAVSAYQTVTFFHLFLSLGLVNLGFLCRFFAKRTVGVRFGDRCLWMIAGSVALWILVLYEPETTSIHQWSLASMLLLYIILVIYIVDGIPKLVLPLLALQSLVMFPLLIFAKPITEQTPGVLFDAPLDVGMSAVALLALSGIVYFGWRVKLLEVS